MPEIPERFRAPVVYALPGMDGVEVRRDLVYRHVEDRKLLMDIYRAPDQVTGERRPAVLFVHGDAPPAILAHAKDWGAYTSWGRLAAVSGLVGITFTHRSTEGRTRLQEACDDVQAAIDYVRSHGEELGVDPDRLCLWVCSAGGFKLKLALASNPTFIRCTVAYYPVLDLMPGREQTPPAISDETLQSFSTIRCVSGEAAPMLLVRAGLDHPVLNGALDAFVQAALAVNMPLALYNHPTGEHAFDIRNPGPRSSEIIGQTLAFMVQHLGA